jgi:carbon monoxide dehydrogenase subunit G
LKLGREHTIPAPPSDVWTALRDPGILKSAIPGCEQIHLLEDGSFRARVKIKVGPVSATFNGRLSFADVGIVDGYRLNFDGQGGAAGFVHGYATVQLRANGNEGTTLTYEAHAQIGGRLAQVGSRLVEGVAVKTSAAFFESFSEILSSQRTPSAQSAGS